MVTPDSARNLARGKADGEPVAGGDDQMVDHGLVTAVEQLAQLFELPLVVAAEGQQWAERGIACSADLDFQRCQACKACLQLLGLALLQPAVAIQQLLFSGKHELGFQGAKFADQSRLSRVGTRRQCRDPLPAGVGRKSTGPPLIQPGSMALAFLG